MSKKRERLSARRLRRRVVPAVGVALVLAVAANVAANVFAPSLDTYLGRGARQVVGGADYDPADTDYYDQVYPLSDGGKVDASHAAYEVSERISDEGSVLLKNDGALPLERGEKVTPLGYRYVEPVMTGTGSGAATLLQDFVVHPDEALASYFDVNPDVEAALEAAEPVYATAEGYKGASDENGMFSGATASVGEFDPSIYSASQVGDYTTGIVFVGRQGGEGGDLQMTPYYDSEGTQIADHQLQLMPYEREAIAFAEEHCDTVVVIVNSPNPMELAELQDDDAVNAILWVGTTGSRGFESMAKILCGEVNPSGRLVDTWARSFADDPTFDNYGSFYYANDADFTHRNEEAGDPAHFVEYEEGIYLGYKYYETRFEGDEAAYADAVLYPFGYGLSYADGVTQELESVEVDEAAGTVTVRGHVTNPSDWDTKEVVQVYVNPPYDAVGSLIEKAAKNLVAFDKVEVAAGATEDFEVSFPLEDLASYDYRGYYSEGAGSYVLEAGTYEVVLGQNAHDEWGSAAFTLDEGVVYYDEAQLSTPMAGCAYVGKRASDEVTATNLYEYASDYMDGVGEFGASGATDKLTRANGLATETTAPVDKVAPGVVVEQFENSALGTFDYAPLVAEEFGTEAPTSGADNGLTLADLRGVAYDDPLWDSLLDQIDYSSDEIDLLLGYGAFNTAALTSVGKGQSNESDGPQAIGRTGISDGTGAACAYAAEVVIASTWNLDLAEEMGRSIGDEALAQNSNGWYAPSVNIHRSPFQGRAYEYYSEDPVLSGFMAYRVVQGAASRGYTPYIKHFAVNDQDTGRVACCTWLDEQTLREVYLKPFEMAVKRGQVEEHYLEKQDDGSYEVKTVSRRAATGMMTSMNYIGGVWTSLDRSLCTTILRDEWGFEGSVITDSATPENDQLVNALQAGNDYFLTFMRTSLTDKQSPEAQWAIRQSVHDICYALVNSNYLQNTGPAQEVVFGMSPWRVALIAVDVVVAAGCVAGVVLLARRTREEKVA